VFGFSEQQIATFGLTFGLGAFILYMLFIIWRLAHDAQAGKLGTLVLFLVLAFGMIGFVAKSVIERLLNV
jgi:predicted Kef-type K+ transport protein